METLSRRIYTAASTTALIVVSVIFLAFLLFVLPAENRRAALESGNRSPDTSLFYTANDLFAMADAYGEEGRAAYIRARVRFDIAWPLVYGAFLCIAISWLSLRIFPNDRRWQFLNLLPFPAVGFDYLENLSASVVMSSFPNVSAWALYSAALFTPLKWLFVGSSFLVATGLFFMYALKRSKKKTSG